MANWALRTGIRLGWLDLVIVDIAWLKSEGGRIFFFFFLGGGGGGGGSTYTFSCIDYTIVKVVFLPWAEGVRWGGL